jgi:hypothetical protein
VTTLRQVEELEKYKKTYKYLRLGMVGVAISLLGAVLIEYFENDKRCFQKSISAYYYTPAREWFVGGLMSIGLALFVIKGRTDWEDAWLNLAGMCAPIVALVPTTNVGTCLSVPSPMGAVSPENLPDWLISSVHNNMLALVLFFVVAFVFALVTGAAPSGRTDRGFAPLVGAVFSFVVICVAVVGVLDTRWALRNLHLPAAGAMFMFLWFAVACNALSSRQLESARFFEVFFGVFVAMPVLAGLAALLAGEHRVFAIEVVEILCFVVFWLAQTYAPRDVAVGGSEP